MTYEQGGRQQADWTATDVEAGLAEVAADPVRLAICGAVILIPPFVFH